MDYFSESRICIRDKIAGTLFFFVFFAVGSLFTFVITKTFLAVLQSRSWVKTPCVIESSSVLEGSQGNDKDHEVHVVYSYIYNGMPYTAERMSLNKHMYAYSDAVILADKFRPGTQSFCYVKPTAPETAVIDRGSLALGLGIPFTLIFVVIGAGGIYLVWRPPLTGAEPTSMRHREKSAMKGKMLFFSIFFLVGAAVLYFVCIRVLVKIERAKSWPVTACEILSSQVRYHEGDNDSGPTYSVDILYSYEFNSEVYKSNRYDFLGGSSSGYQGKEEIVNQYPAGSTRTCFVNPHNPAEAVLYRGVSNTMWIVGAFGGLFMLVGLGGMIGGKRSR